MLLRASQFLELALGSDASVSQETGSGDKRSGKGRLEGRSGRHGETRIREMDGADEAIRSGVEREVGFYSVLSLRGC